MRTPWARIITDSVNTVELGRILPKIKVEGLFMLQYTGRRFIILITVFMLLTISLGAESEVFSVSAEIKMQTGTDSDWLEEADRLMAELLNLDVKMFTLINRVENEVYRKELVRRRSINRKLIYDLAMAINSAISDPGGQ